MEKGVDQTRRIYRKSFNEERVLFERKVLFFLSIIIVTQVKTGISDEEKLLIDATTIVAILHLKGGKYSNLTQVLVYPKVS